jgi:hypothetical protein
VPRQRRKPVSAGECVCVLCVWCVCVYMCACVRVVCVRVVCVRVNVGHSGDALQMKCFLIRSWSMQSKWINFPV